MKLTKEEIALLNKDPQAFLVQAYLSAFPNASIRQMEERLKINRGKIHRVTASVTANVTAKPLQTKGKLAERVTANVTASVTLTSLLKPLFEASFMERSGGMAFVWSAKEMAGLKGLGKQIAFSLKSKGRPDDDNSVANAFPTFLDSIHDPWILGHFSPSIINSKYNEIIASYNQRQRTPSPTDAKQRATDALEALRAGALSVRQQG